ncbi:MAG: hypothetical protein A2504_09810 [Bdellovibrionales bacterium RIFOXYD12_FULL_39_22]|nr:MAG: hypothetical protein A2385_13300 [Bdellovibrionales bacterium RIFOXYB1_FULL_39_21]OFZ41020.1 MAG: hypothetical protein A2485_16810 [Bdellovibrionales bacterium RIFOXYC12_FULL_39_17]OFZ44849.1 MAG: hypothetical protein A2404_10100 [Bdellovibrionales bacterium RIFOXYC1_FULL_39_130]OFZ74314.1 MAG: hypothetical protein A2560_17065 [Bdellovibrionales bacterium RIFOXYD1_FULL_39_84]OFZ92178.1 MAG: hypothetical protein A2504_09810 [Bdellovibrionales bacterium RIFOXYD12_FULL_39_22]HLE12716.1 hy
MTKKKVFSFFVFLLILVVAAAYLVLNFGYSKGSRTGRLVKISQKGFAIRTYEGTMDLGSGDKLTWDFSIHKNALGDELVNHTGEIVELHYKEHLYKLFYETKYNVYGWNKVHKEESHELLCRLVRILKTDAALVEKIRPMILEQDNELLLSIRKCQKMINQGN